MSQQMPDPFGSGLPTPLQPLTLRDRSADPQLRARNALFRPLVVAVGGRDNFNALVLVLKTFLKFLILCIVFAIAIIYVRRMFDEHNKEEVAQSAAATAVVVKQTAEVAAVHAAAASATRAATDAVISREQALREGCCILTIIIRVSNTKLPAGFDKRLSYELYTLSPRGPETSKGQAVFDKEFKVYVSRGWSGRFLLAHPQCQPEFPSGVITAPETGEEKVVELVMPCK